MGKTKSSGFTLIELLIVIGIITLLAAALLPSIIASRAKGNILADQANLTWHYQQIMQLRDQGKAPAAGGHKLVLATWYRGIVDKTEASRDRYFNPALMKDDPYYDQLRQKDLDAIWPSEAAVTSQDTHYAGRASTMRMESTGREPWLADDCELGMPFPKGSINVLYADGRVKELLLDPDLKQYGYTEQDLKEDKPFRVGAGSKHPDLAKLAW